MNKNSQKTSGTVYSRTIIALCLFLAGSLFAVVGVSTQSEAKLDPKATPVKTKTARTKPVSLKPVLPSASAPAAGPSPSSGPPLSPANPVQMYVDSVGPVPNATGEGVTSGGPTCAVSGVDCSTYSFSLDPSAFQTQGASSAFPNGYNPATATVVIQVSWTPPPYEFGSFIEDPNQNVVAENTAGTDPETISIPVSSLQPNVIYQVITTLEIGTPGFGYNGSVSLQQPVPAAAAQCPGCIAPRYQMYFGPDNQSGEPSVGVDWNPNVASLKNGPTPPSPGTPGQNNINLNTGGVSFFTANLNQYQVSFDDCSSPATNTWTSVTFPTEGITTLDPIGFTDHFATGDLGTSYPPPTTPGRTWQTQLSGFSSISAYTDTDGQPGVGGQPAYTPTEGGGPPTGPDHETDGGGPYAPTNLNVVPPVVEPPHPTYANAFYYCSQNIAGDAECSRSDDGGLTFGPGVPIFQNVSQCVGGIHGHVKVARDGTVYVPNFSCSLPSGNQGVAVSTDNGVTWVEHNVTHSGSPKSTSSVDPQCAVGLNSVGTQAGQVSPALYFAYNDQDGTMKVSVSRDRGVTWSSPQDVGAAFGLVNTTFPTVVAGDDNRAAVGFLGTMTGGDGNSDNAVCPPAAAGQTAFTGIWHMYIATTYDGGNTWTTIDATPDSPVQVGPICRGGTLCPGYRNLLDFIGADVDAEGRGYFAIAHGCPNCPNVGATCGSSNALSAIFRQSGGPRLFSKFDPPAVAAPAAPQPVSAVAQTSGGVLVSWLEPDNGGAPITAYHVYRGTTSGGEGSTPLATVPVDATHTQTKYLDATATGATGYYYRVTAVNSAGESNFCQELSVTQAVATGNSCTFPYLTVNGAGTKGTAATNEQVIQSVNIGEPFTSCTDNSITFVMKVPTLDPGVLAGGPPTGQAVLPQNTEYQILWTATDTNGNPETIYVDLDTNCPGTVANPAFTYGRRDPSATGGSFDQGECTSQNPTSACSAISGSYSSDGTIIIKLDVSQPLAFAANTGAASGKGAAFTWDARKAGTKLGSVNSEITLFAGCAAGLLETTSTSSGGDYTRVGNISCSNLVPVAALSADPMSGNAPLTVSFNVSNSHEPQGACGTINTYMIDFGDGSSETYNGTTPPSPAFMHTYSTPGSYPATLTVSDTVGQTSTNLAQTVVTVTSAGAPALTGVASRMTHGAAGPFDIALPAGSPSGIECRTNGSAPGNYTMVFKFANAVSSVQQATVTSGTATVATSAISSTNNKEYLVNLTGVSDAQYVSVSLLNAADSTGAIGNLSGTMGVLIADVDASGRVDSGDVTDIRQQVLQPVTSSNFRLDVDASGRIDSNDVTISRDEALTTLPQ